MLRWIMSWAVTLVARFFIIGQLNSQSLPPDTFSLGTNMSGLSDWGTELPFVDLMRNAREWYTKDAGNPNTPWNTERIAQIKLRPDGYPIEIPQRVEGVRYPQIVATIWAVTDGWPSGIYTVLWDGEGELEFWGSASNIRRVGPNRMEFTLARPQGSQVEMRILRSARANPVRAIRVLMPGTAESYQQEIFNPLWLKRVKAFRTVRFMDWGHTNNWNQDQPWEWEGKAQVGWDQRARMDYYTWTTPKGIPYEIMVRLMNEHDLDGWVCLPHLASAEYAEEMGRFFARNLKSDRKLYVEYSNEIWNWIFGQTQWLNKNGDQRVVWPERILPFVQTALDAFTRGFGGSSPRLIRVVGVQTGWLDVSQRIVRNLKPGTVDAVAAAWYFGLSEQADSELDRLGSRATVADIDRLVRAHWNNNEQKMILAIRDQLVRPMGLRWVFYEGGQHLTSHPFGEEPTYAQALLDIQRSEALIQLYRDWMAWLATLRSPTEPPLMLMHFSLVAPLSARYGSWGLLETLYQDTTKVPAPKWTALEPYLRPVR